MPDTLAAAWKLSNRGAVVFDLANYGAKPPADSGVKLAPKRDSSALDLTLEVVLADGRTARVPLSDVAPIRPPLTARIWKYDYIAKRQNPPSKDHDDILSHYVVPVALFASQLPGFNAADIRAIRFRFDRGPAGTILLDDIGFDLGSSSP